MANFIIIAALFVIAALSSGCQSAVGTTNTNSANTTTANANTVKPVEPKTEASVVPAETVVGSLATPTEAYKTAYELRKNKDVAGLKKIMSDDIKEFLTMMGADDKKSLDDMIKEMCEKPQADKIATRNEKINGDRAELEYLTETGAWKTMDFEKVDGKWLMGFPKADKATGPESEK
jgi:hypothetical protein